jgi:hypothetical protein
MTQNLLSLTPAKELPADSYLAAVTALLKNNWFKIKTTVACIAPKKVGQF